MWYIYDKDTSIILKTMKTAAACKAFITRRQREFLERRSLYVSNDGPLFDWAYADSQYYHLLIEQRVTRRNLITGQEFTQSVNTPRSCDPSSELYWSM